MLQAKAVLLTQKSMNTRENSLIMSELKELEKEFILHGEKEYIIRSVLV